MFDWNNKFAIGNDAIDLQHRYFITLINRISDLLDDELPRQRRQRLFAELRAYAVFHFISEENIAVELGLTGLPGHQERHQEMLAELDERIVQHLDDHCTSHDIVEFLYHWFAGHTYHEDQKLFHQTDRV